MPEPAPQPDPLIAAARAWFDAGYCVIPSHEDGSKRPMGRWKEYQHARPTWEELEGWLASGKYTGIGVICGAVSGNAELLEIEGPGDRAVERLGAVMARAAEADMAGLMATVARGCVEQSAGGGLHMFAHITDGAAKPNTKLAMAGTGPNRHVIAETRGEGGFVIVAPTPGRKGHAAGTSYLFLQGSSPATTPAITAKDRDDIHDLLRWALDEADATPPPPAPTAPSGPVDTSSPFGEFRTRTTWAQILEPLGWRRGPTDADGRTHWTRPGGDRFEGTSATTLEDGPLFVFSTSTDLPAERGLSKEYVHAHYHHGGDMQAASRALRDAGYGTTPPPALAPWTPVDGAALPDVDGMTPEQVEAAVRGAWVREHLPALDWHTLWADDTEEEWIVEPLLAARRLVALYSAPKVGKSLLMLELAAGMAAGRPLLGNPIGPPRRTLYVDFENDPRGDVRGRLVDMDFTPGDLANLVYLSFPTIAHLDTLAGAEQLMAAVAEYACEVVVIDTVSRAVGGDENENDTWLNFYRNTGLRLKQAGVALIRLDHSGKDETKGQRGGSAKSGDVDAIWRMSKAGDEMFDLVCEATRFPVAEQKVTIRRLDGPLRHEVVGDAWKKKRDSLLERMAEVGIPRDPRPSTRAIAKAIRAAGMSVDTGSITASVIDRYCAQVPAWQPSTMPVEGS